ncbi:winged helix DNA-binding domain-containing protein [Yinghuangia soli]|uniref:Winged helix DNA-binding domain-containing protein n=1 Tax=Yinghuangia soli TaxID=2908204 RepID=A0AA41Q6N7_9ACTN|nr:winged helix DNA-binding domain-containing protein [Yinghuangia soli]MCF2532564.1 winged helix DNA-binding domain-containing protein [Yinghuangia soli]
MTSTALLDVRALNRATLERQLLLGRVPGTAAGTVRHLAGMQAQAPRAAYVALWSRLAGFRPEELAGLLTERQVVRVVLMRGTVHLVTADDALGMMALLRATLDRRFGSSSFAKALTEVDLAEAAALSRKFLAAAPNSRKELGAHLAERWPGTDPDALSAAGMYLVGCVQLPPRGLWDDVGPVVLSPLETWLDRPLDAAATLDDLVLRFLGAFGPATVKDAQSWSGLTRLREVFDRLRPGLAVFRGPAGEELFDLPDAPRPDPETPAPVRFLPEYDNLLLSHADRSRVIVGRRAVPLPPGYGGAAGTVLVDGFFQGVWKIAREKGTAVLRIDPFVPPTAAQRADMAAEGEALLGFAAADAEAHDVRIGTPE